MNVLTEPLLYGFMQRGMLAAVMVGILCAVVGCYVVLRGMAYLGDAMAHAILPGIAIAYLLKGEILVGALAAGIVVALGIGFLTRRGTIKEDTAIGILFAATLSLGVALIALDLTHILFGNVLGVSETDLAVIALLSAGVLLVIILLYKELLVVSFDAVLAATLRLPTELLKHLLLILIAIVVVVSLQTVGVGLVAAMLVTPAATAYLLTRRLPSMMLVAALLGAAASVVGLYLSYYLNIVSGAAIVLTATAFFFLAYLFAPARGIVWHLHARRKHAARASDAAVPSE
ncbi:MAG: manganese ABC transporter permease [Chloroflexi bacterium]|nr:MAG: manganese ABC transporter permease [Chloroflexota bacterium]